MSQRAQLTGEFNHSRTATATIKFVLFYWSVGTFNIQQCPQKKKLHPCILLHCFSSTLFFCFFSSASPSIFFSQKCLGSKKKKKKPKMTPAIFCDEYATVVSQLDNFKTARFNLSTQRLMFFFFLSFLDFLLLFFLLLSGARGTFSKSRWGSQMAVRGLRESYYSM